MLSRLKKYFFSGLAIFLPLVLAIYVFVWLMNFVESLLGKYLKPFFLEYYDFYFWGIGILILVLLILFSGFLITHYFGRVIHRTTEKLVLQVPLLGMIYPAFKEISKFFFQEKARFDKVVLVEWPCKGAYVIGFLTNPTVLRISDKVGKKLSNVMIPSVPNPLTGFIVMLPDELITPLDITVEEAVKIIVSGGVINLENIESADDLDDLTTFPAPQD
jgi:uncharacterized membrane protein